MLVQKPPLLADQPRPTTKSATQIPSNCVCQVDSKERIGSIPLQTARECFDLDMNVGKGPLDERRIGRLLVHLDGQRATPRLPGRLAQNAQNSSL